MNRTPKPIPAITKGLDRGSGREKEREKKIRFSCFKTVKAAKLVQESKQGGKLGRALYHCQLRLDGPRKAWWQQGSPL